ncbi:MAG: SPASM domain-containing protein, partial [Nitrospirota bacterium]|nr:SPASM domain-containing protein [Nitrospirota bacterium]
VVPCCFDYSGKYIVGDVKLERIAEVWNSPKMQELRKNHLSGIINNIELCRNCSGYKGNFIELIASVFVDSLNIRKLTPIWNQVR